MTAPIVLADGVLHAEVSRHGAELGSLRRVTSGIEYLWQGDPAVWSRRAPILFPIVGRLRGDRYLVGSAEYALPPHGFARDSVFSVTRRSDTEVALAVQESPETLRAYPFPFRLEVAYALRRDLLVQRVVVANPGHRPLPFSLGLHPGFRCPLLPGETLEDYAVEFELPETAGRLPVLDGLVSRQAEPFLEGQRILPLRPGMFDRGALVFKKLQSQRVRLVSRSGKGVELTFRGFPYFAIWSKPAGGFVCLEPWCGVADPPDASGRIEDKEGIMWLAPGGMFARAVSLRPL